MRPAHPRHFVVARPSTPQARALLILSTNTWASYNYWGAPIPTLPSKTSVAGRGRRRLAPGRDRSAPHAPYPQLQLAPPEDVPRLINLTPRAPGASASGSRRLSPRTSPLPLRRRRGLREQVGAQVRRLVRAQCRIDIATDHDFETEPDLLDTYAAHSGRSQRVLGGPSAQQLNASSTLAADSQCSQATPATGKSAGKTTAKRSSPTNGAASPTTRSGTILTGGRRDPPLVARTFGAPEASLFGLSFLYGGYHRLCMCASRGAPPIPFTTTALGACRVRPVRRSVRWRYTLIGYENDGVPITFGADGLPKADGGLGVPQNLEIIALAPATLAESPDSFSADDSEEMPEVLARIAWGDVDAVDRLMRGHAVMASFAAARVRCSMAAPPNGPMA